VSLSALCEVAEETAGGGDLAELRARLAELRRTEAPEGIEQAEAAAAALERTIQPPPRVASSDYLDALGTAARRLEQALGDDGGSPFAVAMQHAVPVVEELTADVEQTYKGPLA
jgi:phosphohistidine phosphatase SixA